MSRGGNNNLGLGPFNLNHSFRRRFPYDSGSPPRVHWTNFAGTGVVFPSGDFATFSSGGCFSVESIGSNGGEIVFPVASILTGTGGRLTGLSNSDPDQSYPSILFCIDQFENQSAVFESGNNRGAIGNVTALDSYKITVSNAGLVKYYINNSLVYTSGVTATFPLFVDTALTQSGLIHAPTLINYP